LSEGLNCGGFLQDPQNSVQILEDEPLTSNADHEGGNSGQFVQITPQRVKLKLRPGISTTLTFKGSIYHQTQCLKIFKNIQFAIFHFWWYEN